MVGVSGLGKGLSLVRECGSGLLGAWAVDSCRGLGVLVLYNVLLPINRIYR